MEEVIKVSEAGAVADIVERLSRPMSLKFFSGTTQPNGEPLQAEGIVLPSGMELHSIKRCVDEYRTCPERRKGTSKHVELASFIALVNRFRDEHSTLWASPDPHRPTLTAVFDYHEANNRAVLDGEDSVIHGAPRFGTHRAVYVFPVADEWCAWIAQNGKPMSQGEFASFLEDRILDVADPANAFTAAKALAEAIGVPSFASAAKLLELSRGLTIHVDDRVTNKINPSTGEATFHFETTHNDEAGAPLVVPRAFLIQIPVFRGGAAYQLPVRLRYRTAGGKVTWSYELHQAQRSFDDAIREASDLAAEKTSLPLHYGSPEEA